MSIFDLLIVQPIFNLLIALYSIIPGGDFGVSIIIFTILVRFALYPLTKRMLHQTKAMRKLQPELKKIKKANKGNRQAESMQMLELYKKNGVKPFRSILILLIQLPIFIGLFWVIRIFTDQRDRIEAFTYGFLENIEPIRRIIDDPSSFNETLFGFIDLTKPAIGAHGVEFFLILLALVAAYTQYIMSKQTMPQQDGTKRLRDIMAEAAEGKQADQAEMNAIVMNKMIKVLPIFMFFIMITVPGALALYYGVSNLVAVLQQSYLLKQDVDEMEDIAEEPSQRKSTGKKATVKAREKAAKEANVVRITAKDTKGKK